MKRSLKILLILLGFCLMSGTGLCDFDKKVEAARNQEYKEAIKEFINEYKKLFPKHLEDDAYRLSVNLYIDLYTEIISYAQKNNLIEMPTENSYCDVLRELWY